MTDKEAFEMIGERAEEIAKKPEAQKKMLQIAKEDGKEEAEKVALYVGNRYIMRDIGVT